MAAASIQYHLDALGGNVYRYVYTVTNNPSAGAVPIQLFDLYFDTALYQESSLQIVTGPPLQAQWSEQLLSSLPGIPAAYDVLSLSVGIPVGGSVTGFAVQFRWTGAGSPGTQPFRVFDPISFLVLQNGQTNGPPLTVPTLSTWSMIVAGVGLAFASAYQARRQAEGRAGVGGPGMPA